MPSNDGRDRDILVLIAAGETSAFEELYDRHSAAAYGLAFRILGDPGAAEDVVQEAFLSVWRQATVYTQDRGTARSWVLTIVHHRAIDHIRRRHDDRHQAIEDFDVLPDNVDTGEQVDSAT